MVPGIPVPVELVTSPDQLGVGVVVWVKPCALCGGVHRCMLVKEVKVFPTAWSPAWDGIPRPKCAVLPLPVNISAAPWALADGTTYREVIDLTDPAEETERTDQRLRRKVSR